MPAKRRLTAPGMNVRSWRLAGGGVAALVTAAGLAGWGLGFGLPFEFRPDEDVLVGRSVHMAAEGSLDPLFANWPPLVFYLLAAAEKITGNLGGATGADPSGAYLTGRVLSAVAFVATVGLVLLAARRAYGEGPALLAAFVTALSPLAVREAHMATIDGVQTALVAATLLAGVGAGSRRGFATAGVLAGLAAAAKYTGGLSLVYVLVMALQSPDRRGNLLSAVAGAAAAFGLPGLIMLVHPRDYLGGLVFLGGRGYAQSYGTPLGWFYHPVVSLPFGLGLGAYALALAGAVVAAIRRQPVDRALLIYVAVYLIVVGAGHEVFWRYVLPLVPALASLAGGLLRALPERAVGPGLAVALLLLIPSAWASANTDRLLAATDTRAQAAGWLQANAPPGATIQAAYYVSPFYDQEMVDGNRRWSGNALAAGFMQGRYTDRYLIGGPDPDYVLVGSSIAGQGPPPGMAGRPVLATFSPGRSGAVYDPIDSFYVPIWGFDGLMRPGPTIVIYGRR